jgi:serine/threonine protein kinase
VDPKSIAILRKATIVPKLDLTKMIRKDWYGEEEIALAADLVDKMLRWVPSDRISAREALNHPFLSGIPFKRINQQQ